MPTADLPFLSVAELAIHIRQRQISPVEVIQTALARIDRLNPAINAFVYVDGERALAAARAAEIDISAGNYRGELHGIPIAYKDLFDVAGLPTTAGSRVLAGYVADRDSTFAARVCRAGGICLGKLNTQEFASGSMDLFGDTRNPWDLSRTSGGSSAGSAAAVAAGMAYLAAGTDTGGSIRMPAAFCGVVGLKPTYGRVSRAGIVPLSWSMDHPGPLARTVLDATLLLQVVAGADHRDPTAAWQAVPDYKRALRTDLAGVRLGLPTTHFFDGGDPEVIAAVHTALTVMRQLGATVFDVDLPCAQYGQAAAWAIAYSEAFAFHQTNLFARRQEYGPAIVRKVASGAFLRADELVTANQVRQAITAELVASLQDVDAVVAPTNLYPAHLLGTAFPSKQRPRGVPPEGDLTLLTRPVSLSGLPALSLPCGFTASHLPIGMQLIGRAFDEGTLLRVGHAYEAATDWTRRRPPFDEAVRAHDDRVPVLTMAPSPRSTGVDVDWVRNWAALAGLSFLDEGDIEPIAGSIRGVKEALAAARQLVSGVEPAVRPAPVTRETQPGG
jgi:aspartyl-tRNA(Asn)/glutamyl-tRNA(Gln) amidotransferase subunit A